jgi:argininosuccinate lyase
MTGGRREPNDSPRKLWDKGYRLDRAVEEFTVGDDYLLDRQLVRYDCLASIAHATMLGRVGVLEDQEVQSLVDELSSIIALDERGEFEVLREHEDCHTAIENHLTRQLGDLGQKIHTGRSRNDQVVAALRLYYKDRLGRCKGLVADLVQSIEGFVARHGGVKFPGYTHTRKAMPSTMGLWAGSFAESMDDNLRLLDLAVELIDQNPLGTGAGYGVPLEVDREQTAQLLDFARVQTNPLYVQNSRGKFEATILHAMSQVMLDLNRLAADLIVFSMPELGYFELPEELCTGSSIMPQKRNPDVLELMRARYHLVVAYEFQVENTVGNLLSGYNRDVQLTKGPTMKGLEVTLESLAVAALVFERLGVNEERCAAGLTDEVYATERVYELVKQGVPFREAYRRVAREL